MWGGYVGIRPRCGLLDNIAKLFQDCHGQGHWIQNKLQWCKVFCIWFIIVLKHNTVKQQYSYTNHQVCGIWSNSWLADCNTGYTIQIIYLYFICLRSECVSLSIAGLVSMTNHWPWFESDTRLEENQIASFKEYIKLNFFFLCLAN